MDDNYISLCIESSLSLLITLTASIFTVIGIGTLFSSLARTGKVPEGITGIVGIARLTHTTVQEGFMSYLRLVALHHILFYLVDPLRRLLELPVSKTLIYP